MKNHFTVRPVSIEQAPELTSLLRSQSPAYVRFFSPFNFDHATISGILANLKKDVLSGIYARDRMIGFFMLRGWDEGYEVPTYGVLIDERYSGYGLGRMTLKMAKSICLLRRSPRIMLKVHPEHHPAKALYEEAKFIQTGIDAKSGNLIYHLNLHGRATTS